MHCFFDVRRTREHRHRRAPGTRPASPLWLRKILNILKNVYWKHGFSKQFTLVRSIANSTQLDFFLNFGCIPPASVAAMHSPSLGKIDQRDSEKFLFEDSGLSESGFPFVLACNVRSHDHSNCTCSGAVASNSCDVNRQVSKQYSRTVLKTLVFK